MEIIWREKLKLVMKNAWSGEIVESFLFWLNLIKVEKGIPGNLINLLNAILERQLEKIKFLFTTIKILHLCSVWSGRSLYWSMITTWENEIQLGYKNVLLESLFPGKYLAELVKIAVADWELLVTNEIIATLIDDVVDMLEDEQDLE